MNISIPGSHDCYRRTPYCGGFTDGPITVFPSGQTSQVTMQQNLNHFYTGKPGYFILQFSESMAPSASDWVVLDKWDDWPGNEMINQINFTRYITFPDVECNPCLLGAQYVSYNPYEVDPSSNTDAIFYNCANIALQKQTSVGDSFEETPEPFTIKQTPRKVQDDVESCCTPDVWEGEGIGNDYQGEYTIRVVWDAKLKRTRWDRKGFIEPPGNASIDSTIITFYDSGPPFFSYVIDNTLGTCAIYGADEFYDWCFGSDRSMTTSQILDFEEEKVIVWQNPTNQFTFTAHHERCLPRTLHHQSSSWAFNRYRLDFNATHFFDLPSSCSTAKWEDPCGKKLPEDDPRRAFVL
eukprot:CAMPEP_0201522898 /NCGR_PEP_ID=MMETSP0161_2-20130828/18622_1 /ASSEMBLY_ACC=CAM_ASM_000251 /TAXON_ID=180227 /ORGANISM="Neoparamoeba aestuarina, Strain SoJaBio B1-5/56/2" /LENGTH=350 /DNA_ID=CAMNT_0047921861 /DNA_START=102 /DNA_END=1154 /DNA_ORIENTATION=+